jgi:RNA polymerase sigma factor (sigma-70 family)
MTNLVERYGNEMLRLALLYLGSKEQAEDAVQDSFLKIFRAGDPEKICKTFVMRVLVNTCKDYRKSGWARSVSLVEEMPEILGEEDASPHDPAGYLRQAILALPLKYREVILLRYYEDMAVGEIARALSIPQPTVSIRLKRACERLQKGLEGIPRRVKISSETVHQALDDALSGISLSEWDRRRILAHASARPARPRGRAMRRTCAMAVSFALAMACATGVLAAVPGLAEKLSMLSRQTLAYITPIEKETTAQEIRMEVIAAMNDGDTAIIYVGLQDLSGQNRLDDTTMLEDFTIDGIADTMCDNVYRRDDGTVVVRIVGTSRRGENLSGKKVTLHLYNILSQCHDQESVDTGYTVAQIQKENPNPALGSCITADSYWLNGSLDGPLYQLLESGKLQTLKAVSSTPLPSAPWLKILNGGVVGNMLHILTDPDDDAWYDSANFFLVDAAGNAYDAEVANVDVGQKIHRGRNWEYSAQQEQILELPDGVEPSEMHLWYSTNEYDACVEGQWDVTFALQAATASISVPCTLDMQPWQTTDVEISPIGITVNGNGEMTEESLSPEIGIVLDDGTMAENYCNAVTVMDDGEQSNIQMTNFFDEPLDTSRVVQVTINGKVIWQKDAQAA